MTDRAMPGTRIDVVSVKGFGDLVINLTCFQRIAPDARSRFRFLVGEHLAPLWNVLAPPFASAVLPHADQGAAALFQVHSRPLGDVARSALSVRRAIRRAHDPASLLLFDEYDVRHRFLAFGSRARGLPQRDNLYRAWNGFLAKQGVADAGEGAVPMAAGRRLHIFPGARETERRFPLAVLHQLVDRATAVGLEPRIFTVAGEMPHLADADLPLEEMPRDFAATIAAVMSADRVVSADSMTAHLSEYCARPVYVLAPVEKFFWLPLSSAQAGRHALFSDNPDASTLPAFLYRDNQSG